MEWVETTGRTVEDAKEAALDELGVDEGDAEFEILAEAQTGLFGRLRTEARVRARVQPTAPRAKEDRRDRRDRKRRAAPAAPAEGTGKEVASTSSAPSLAPTPEPQAPQATDTKARRRRSRSQSRTGPGSGGMESAGTEPDGMHAGDDGASIGGTDIVPASPAGNQRSKGTEVEVALDEQAEIAKDFLDQLAAEFGLKATVGVKKIDEETVELELTGSDLGILIGPKGATLLAVQNLTRTVVFNETGANNGHINVDVGGYRQKRNEALVRFATSVANTVKQSGKRTAMEPMSSLDRKVVHDAVADIAGVSTISEGEEPRRRVVVLPD